MSLCPCGWYHFLKSWPLYAWRTYNVPIGAITFIGPIGFKIRMLLPIDVNLQWKELRKIVKFWWAVEGTTYRGHCKSLLCVEMTLTFQAFLGCAPHHPRLIYEAWQSYVYWDILISKAHFLIIKISPQKFDFCKGPRKKPVWSRDLKIWDSSIYH